MLDSAAGAIEPLHRVVHVYEAGAEDILVFDGAELLVESPRIGATPTAHWPTAEAAVSIQPKRSGIGLDVCQFSPSAGGRTRPMVRFAFEQADAILEKWRWQPPASMSEVNVYLRKRQAETSPSAIGPVPNAPPRPRSCPLIGWEGCREGPILSGKRTLPPAANLPSLAEQNIQSCVGNQEQATAN